MLMPVRIREMAIVTRRAKRLPGELGSNPMRTAPTSGRRRRIDSIF
jgi:hypothetical protein